MRYTWQRWTDLSIRERLTFLQALFLLPLAGLVLRLGRYQSVLSGLQKATLLKERWSKIDPLPEARRTAELVKAAARRGALRRNLFAAFVGSMVTAAPSGDRQPTANWRSHGW